MNILFVLSFYPNLGGVETVTGNLADYLSTKHKIYTLSYKVPHQFHGDKQETKAVKAEGISECFHFPSYKADENAVFYNSLVKELAIDCVINQGMFPCFDPIIFSPQRDRKVKVISCLHGMPEYEKSDFWLNQEACGTPSGKIRKRKLLASIGLYSPYRRHIKLYKTVYNRCVNEGDKVVLLADSYIEDFIKAYKCRKHREKICAIPNPLPGRYSKIGEPEWDQKENMVLYVGRLTKEKQVGLILDVWKRAFSPDWKLVIVGDGPERQCLEHKVHKEQINNVHFEGFQNKVDNYYKKAKILLLTSRFEGFGMCLIESMRYGVRPIAFATSRGVEYVLQSNAGELIPYGNTALMAETLERLMADDKKLQELGGISYSSSNDFTIEQIGSQWENLFKSL